jgi:hypothetical protein
MKSTSYPRIAAVVSYLTWVPSDGGRVNTTDKHAQHMKMWVNHPLDERYRLDDRGGDQAIAIAKRTAEKRRHEWLGLLGVAIDTEMTEDSFVNQPKDAAIVADTGLKLV